MGAIFWVLKKIGKYALIFLVAFGLVAWLGPREPVDQKVVFDKNAIAGDLDAYLAKSESGYSDIRAGAQKQIIWYDENQKNKTPLSIVYIHGFSATLEEVRPLPDIVAKGLGANLFYTRLSGHGRSGEAMAEPSVNDWLTDTVEAIEIGKRLGERVVVMSTSTGGTFSTWAATKPALMKNVAGMILISPNFSIKNPATPLLTLGAARYWLPPLAGTERSFEPSNDEHGKWWTTRYPTVAVLPMAESVRFANGLDFGSIDVPALFIYSPDDKVIDQSRTEQIATEWGGKTTTELVVKSEDSYNHVIAGRILSPSNSEPLAAKAIAWIKSL